jgi:SOS-response transcriptional repressor LexA
MELTKMIRSSAETFGEYVARLRNADGRSRKYIVQRAQRAGHEISESYLKKIEEDGMLPHAISLGKMEALAAGLGVARQVLEDAIQQAGSPPARPKLAPDVRENTKGFTPADVDLIGGHRVRLPYYGRVGCGVFLELREHPDDMREVPASYLADVDDYDYGTMEAAGDSMNLAGIHPGMTLLVRRTDFAQHGDVVLANVPYQGTTCKRYCVRPDGHYLVAESTTPHPEIKMDDEIKVVGVVKRAWLVTEF